MTETPLGMSLARRLVRAVLLLLVGTFIAFCLLRVGTNPVASFRRANPRARPDRLAGFVHDNGLEDGVGGYVSGYARWLGTLLQGPGGWPRSIRANAETWPQLRAAIANTLRIVGVALLVGTLAGKLLAHRLSWKPAQRTLDLLDRWIRVIPAFVVALALQTFFAKFLGKFPFTGVYEPTQRGFDLKEMLKHLALPAGVVTLPVALRVRRLAVAGLAVTVPNFVRTVGGLCLGSVIFAEVVFDYPGVGRLFVQALNANDFPLLMPAMALMVLAVVIADFACKPADRPVVRETGGPSRIRPGRNDLIGVLVAAAAACGIAALAPVLARYGAREPVVDLKVAPNQNLSPRGLALLGTDNDGYDVFSRLLYGARTTLLIATAGALLAVLIGTLLAAVAARRMRPSVRGRLHVAHLVPTLVALLLIRESFHGLHLVGSVIVAIAALGAAAVAVELLDGDGDGPRPLLAAFLRVLLFGVAAEAALSFLGNISFGGTGSLGTVLRLSQAAALGSQWWLVVFPCGALLVVIAVLEGSRARFASRRVPPSAEDVSALPE